VSEPVKGQYRCPLCLRSFGGDRDAFRQHLADRPSCGTMAKLLTEIAGTRRGTVDAR
jgi:hypothetical protein